MDLKPLVAIFKKDIVILSQRLQKILLRIHQYRVRIIYKPVPDLFIVDQLSRQNHSENKGKEIAGMQLSIKAIQSTTNILQCMKMQVSRPTPTVSHGVHHTRVA